MLENYIKRFGLRDRIIDSPVSMDLGMSIVIPSHSEGDISMALESILHCAKPEGVSIELILVINASEKDGEDIVSLNKLTKECAIKYQGKGYPLHIIEELQLPEKKAGVGLARKIGMDEAAKRLFRSSQEIKVIACFDADSQCEPSYLKELYSFFKFNKDMQACSIYFEHPIEEKDYSDEILEGILFYEMHLRYYKNALKMAGSPYGFHTIGSSMAIKADAYLAQGGMNQRKAGEDFYFLQKFMKIGKLAELNSTMVIPSPRASERVPFGTGRAIQEYLDGKREIDLSYNFQSFLHLKGLFEKLELIYSELEYNKDFHLLENFLGEEVFVSNMERIKKISSSLEDFIKRFHQWFDAFATLKFIHFLRDNHFPDKPLSEEVNRLLDLEEINPKKLLNELRKKDRT